MESSDQGAPRGRPTAAGMYEVFLGDLGGNHYPELDRVAAENAMAAAPEAAMAARENRKFVQRAVHYLAGQGIRQYIDMGSGFPANGQVHEIAAEIVRDPHVVYVDHDPLVAREGQALIPEGGNVIAITADLRQPWHLISSPDVNRVIDLSLPVALLYASVLHFVSDEENPREILAIWREHVAPGSYLLISHASPGENPEGAEESAQAWRRSRTPIHLRSPAEIQDLFVGWDFEVSHELVTTSEWSNDTAAPEDQALIIAAVGRYR